MTQTEKTKQSMIRRLESVGLDPLTVTQDDYALIFELLGWKESTFKSFLQYMGKPNGTLYRSPNDYEPTPTDLKNLREHLGPFQYALEVLGCRWSAMWTLKLEGRNVVVDDMKGGEHVTVHLDSLDPKFSIPLETWITKLMPEVGPKAMRYRWDKLQEEGLVNPKCKPHCMRHRLITKALQAGVDPLTVARMVGHRSIQSTLVYTHANPTVQAEVRNKIEL